MKNLKLKYPDHYDWLYPISGNWHLMKTAPEVLKHIMADGRFKIFPSKCGHKGEIKGRLSCKKSKIVSLHQGGLSRVLVTEKNIHRIYRFLRL